VAGCHCSQFGDNQEADRESTAFNDREYAKGRLCRAVHSRKSEHLLLGPTLFGLLPLFTWFLDSFKTICCLFQLADASLLQAGRVAPFRDCDVQSDVCGIVFT
jgi:hypothetical protein